MTIREYQQLAQLTSSNDGHDKILSGQMGLICEAGEVVDIVKKWKFQSGQDAPLPKKKLIEKIGDVLWYAAEWCAGNGIELEDFVKTDMLRYKPANPILIGFVLDIAYYAVQMSTVNAEMACYPLTVLFAACGRILTIYCNSSMSDAMEKNIERLKQRYPDGFDAEKKDDVLNAD